jgi:hypothetical protein
MPMAGSFANTVAAILLIGLAATDARADKDPTDYRPYCRGVDFTLSESEKNVLAPAIARQLKEVDVYHQDSVVEITDSLRYGGWWLLAVQNGLSDGAYLFYPGDPRQTMFVKTWGGAATIYEGPDMEHWTIANVPKIPKHLARCFSRYVLTHGTG